MQTTITFTINHSERIDPAQIEQWLRGSADHPDRIEAGSVVASHYGTASDEGVRIEMQRHLAEVRTLTDLAMADPEGKSAWIYTDLARANASAARAWAESFVE